MKVGDVVGTRTVVEVVRANYSTNGRPYTKYRLLCHCGAEVTAQAADARRYCAKCSVPKRTEDLTGQVFGTRTVVGECGKSRWLVKCSCGLTAKMCRDDMLEKQCRGCTPGSGTSEQLRRLFSKLISCGVSRSVALRHIKQLPKPSAGLSFRHILAAYRAAITETMRDTPDGAEPW